MSARQPLPNREPFPIRQPFPNPFTAISEHQKKSRTGLPCFGLMYAQTQTSTTLSASSGYCKPPGYILALVMITRFDVDLELSCYGIAKCIANECSTSGHKFFGNKMPID